LNLKVNHLENKKIKIFLKNTYLCKYIDYLYAIEITNKKIEIMTVSASTISDVKSAFEFGKQRLSYIAQLEGEWIYAVDPETMDEVKSLYSKAAGNMSLYGMFCKILKLK